ncbi:transposase [Mesorhizobium sp. LSJC265A00]|uniref:hypothetical protein n=1 Tax=Mesorhizobium sp. LSJC265A00 TaxID=1287322 RepID=UPI0003CE1672|nr:hypothetical protein [Mesorhizobium sp. LSJC265A00]ESX08362.1 transposase [Mesorhizobium sp. LSJC265A00]
MKSGGPYRRHSTQFKLQLCQGIRGGAIGRRDAQRTYSVSANLIQLWLTQFDRGELNDEEAEASVIADTRRASQLLSARSANSRWNWTLPKKHRANRPLATARGPSSSPALSVLNQTGM